MDTSRIYNFSDSCERWREETTYLEQDGGSVIILTVKHLLRDLQSARNWPSIVELLALWRLLTDFWKCRFLFLPSCIWMLLFQIIFLLSEKKKILLIILFFSSSLLEMYSLHFGSLFVLKHLNFSFIFEYYSLGCCFFFQYFKDIIPLPSGFHYLS